MFASLGLGSSPGQAVSILARVAVLSAMIVDAAEVTEPALFGRVTKLSAPVTRLVATVIRGVTVLLALLAKPAVLGSMTLLLAMLAPHCFEAVLGKVTFAITNSANLHGTLPSKVTMFAALGALGIKVVTVETTLLTTLLLDADLVGMTLDTALLARDDWTPIHLMNTKTTMAESALLVSVRVSLGRR